MTKKTVSVKREVEVVGVHKRTNDCYLISLRKIRPETEEIPMGEAVNALLGGLYDVIPKELSAKFSEGMRRSEQATKELRRRFLEEHSEDVLGDFMTELNEKEYNDLLRPSVGHHLTVSIETDVYAVVTTPVRATPERHPPEIDQ